MSYFPKQPFFALTLASNLIAVPMRRASNYKVTLNANATLSNPVGAQDGDAFLLRLTVDGTGGYTFAYGNKYRFSESAEPTLNLTANAVNYIGVVYDSDADKFDVLGGIGNLLV